MNEFKAFAVRGNVVDMAVGIIMGAAFGKIVSSLVNDLIMKWSTNAGHLVKGLNYQNEVNEANRTTNTETV